METTGRSARYSKTWRREKRRLAPRRPPLRDRSCARRKCAATMRTGRRRARDQRLRTSNGSPPDRPSPGASRSIVPNGRPIRCTGSPHVRFPSGLRRRCGAARADRRRARPAGPARPASPRFRRRRRFRVACRPRRSASRRKSQSRRHRAAARRRPGARHASRKHRTLRPRAAGQQRAAVGRARHGQIVARQGGACRDQPRRELRRAG